MFFNGSKKFRSFLLFLVSIIIAVPASLRACACGCGIFDVGTSAMLPTHPGGMAFLEYDFMDQDQNWSGTSKASPDDNSDKRIKTHFMTAGAQYMFNRRWGMKAEVPFWNRNFITTYDDGNIAKFNHSALGDVRIQGIFSGFSPDMSTGLTFGLKLPTGDDKFRHFDRDTSIGTGSTNILLGAFHVGQFAAKNWNWFANSELDQSVLITPDYRPGTELNAVTGAYYNGWKVGNVKMAPLGQVLGSIRWSDTGNDSNHPDSGYKRVFLSPGLEFDAAGWRIYADVAFPIYTNVNGNQLVASELYKLNMSRAF